MSITAVKTWVKTWLKEPDNQQAAALIVFVAAHFFPQYADWIIAAAGALGVSSLATSTITNGKPPADGAPK